MQDLRNIDIREIKKLAKRFSHEQIEGCITQQLETGGNICLTEPSSERVINELAKAEFVRKLIAGGMTIADALRELARQMRRVQEGFKK